MKRILIFSLSYSPFVGGAELAVQNITDRISPDNIEFDMITLRYDKKLPRYERIGNVAVHRIGFSKNNPSAQDLLKFPMYINKIAYPFMAFLKAVRLHRKHPYSALWCIMTYMGFPAIFFKWLYPNIPMILTLQDGDSIEHITKRKRIKIIYPIFKKIFLYANVVQAISEYLAKFARDMGTKGRVIVIPNGVDLEKFGVKKDQFSTEQLRKKLNIKQSDRAIISVSRLVAKNGVDIIIRAMDKLPKDTHLLVLGDGPLLEDFKKQIADVSATLLQESDNSDNLRERIHFLGNIGNSDVPKYLALSDVFVRPSRSEGMGTAFIEAMTAGVPIVATAVGGITDFLYHNKTGLICRVDDADDLSEKIFQIFDNRQLRESIITNAKSMALSRYSWDKIALQMKNVLESE